jgi:stage II sporulation protein D
MRPPLRTVLAVLAAGTAAVGLAHVGGAQAKAVDQTFPVPAGGVFKVQGHGWGHGHGMSQYGARGAARQGLTWSQIVAFYYPGTKLARATDEIRVLISADTSSDVVVSATSGLSVRDRTTGTAYALPVLAGVSRWRLMPDGAKNAVAYLDTTWHRWKLFDGDAEFFASDKPLTLWLPSGSRSYRGALRAAAPSQGSTARDTVNVLSIDEYVKGVVPAEMPPSWETEAVRAQAVAARTYAAWSRATRASSSWQICDTTSCQVYAGAGSEDLRANAAVSATAGQILTYAGQPAFSQFSSSSGGWTSAGSVPYLVAKADPYETESSNPYTNWSTSLSAISIQQRFPAIGTLQQIKVTSREGGGEWEGRVWSLTLDGSTKDVVVSGDSFRSAFRLRSTYFTFGATATPVTPIMARWNALGGAASPLGEVLGSERAVRGGIAQDFANGSIYYSTKYGAWEVYGPILATYRARGESSSSLGMPRLGVQARGVDGFRVRFAGGVIFTRPATGTVALTGPIASAYLRLKGVVSPLGWPVKGNFAVRPGERALFQHGRITWVKRTGKTRVVISQ